jgi:hypothetical protein
MMKCEHILRRRTGGRLAAPTTHQKLLKIGRETSMMLQPYTRIQDDEKASAWWSETNYREGKVQNGLESQEILQSRHSVGSRHRNNFKLSLVCLGVGLRPCPVEPLLVELCIQRAWGSLYRRVRESCWLIRSSRERSTKRKNEQ